jgi:hypothetical protein
MKALGNYKMKEQAWGAGLEDNGDSNRIHLPKTLAQAVGISNRVTKGIPATEATMDLTIAKLQDIAKQVKEDFNHLSRFPDKNQGLAMNKLANIQYKIEEIITSLESDIK